MDKPDLPKLPDSPLPDMPDEKPHRMIDSILDTVQSIPTRIGGTLSGVLDKLPLGNRGPHSTIESVAQGIGTAGKTVGEGVAEGLDKPLDAAKGI